MLFGSGEGKEEKEVLSSFLSHNNDTCWDGKTKADKAMKGEDFSWDNKVKLSEDFIHIMHFE